MPANTCPKRSLPSWWASAGSIETGQFNPTAKLALLLCIALDWNFEDLFYFTEAPEKKKRYF